MSNNTTDKVYGLFYKSRGTWTGPYKNQTWTLTSGRTAKKSARRVLKSSVILRKIKFA